MSLEFEKAAGMEPPAAAALGITRRRLKRPATNGSGTWPESLAGLEVPGKCVQARARLDALSERLAKPNRKEASLGSVLLENVSAFMGRFVAYPSEHARVAHTLWIAHTHLMGAWDSTPRIAFLSPEPGSGKTRALEVSELLVPRPVETINVTPAYLFRKVGVDQNNLPTILFDEIDTVFGPRAKENEEVRGLLNAGHRRGAVTGRCVVRGKVIETEEIPAFCAVALAGLGNLPDTVLSRAVVIRMRRRSAKECIEPFRRREHLPAGHTLCGQLEAWATKNLELAAGARPIMPAGVEDRAADMWEALLAVADLVGGEWPERARKAAVTFVTAARESSPSLGVKLLSDIRTAFGERPVMSSHELLQVLGTFEESPWAEINKGKALNAEGLARRLREYQIRPAQVRHTSTSPQVRGYERVWFEDAWQRYLPPSLQKPVTPVTPVTDGRFVQEIQRSTCDGFPE